MFFSFDYVIKEMVNAQRATMELWMHLAGLLSTQEARGALGVTFTFFSCLATSRVHPNSMVARCSLTIP